jgi:hypothetical protein
MSVVFGAITAAAAVVGIYIHWAVIEPEKKNEAINYTLEKLSTFENSIECETLPGSAIRTTMEVVSSLRPKAFGTPPILQSRCAPMTLRIEGATPLVPPPPYASPARRPSEPPITHTAHRLRLSPPTQWEIIR